MIKPKLIVKNFLNIEDVELELSKINAIIGRQATGKSVLAKLVFYFQSCFWDCVDSAFNTRTQDIKESELIKIYSDKFYQIFPKYAWKNQSFTIIYQQGDYQTNLKLDKISHELKIEYSDHFREKINSIKESQSKDKKSEETIKEEIKGEVNKFKSMLYDFAIEQNLPPDKATEILKYIEDFIDKYAMYMYEDFMKVMIESRIMKIKFIPAGRTFFSNLQKNIFLLLIQDIQIDYFSKEFGADYEKIKNDYRNLQEIAPEVSRLISQIISGKYIYEGDEDWIESATTKQKIRLMDASSGQQEALPMLLMLAGFSAKKEPHSFFIEEPEAHLFPTSQKHIIDLIGLLFNQAEKRNSFFITTHSPYILTALDNLIQAGNTLKAINQIKSEQLREEMLQKLYAICPENQILDIEDIGAYTIEDGKIRSIINEENQLIDQNIVDEVSQDIGKIFDDLIDLEFAAKEVINQ